MKAHERIMMALNHEEADRIPTFTQTIEPEFIERYDDEVEIIGAEGLPIDLQIAKELGYDSKWYHAGKLKKPDFEQPEAPKELLHLLKGRVVGGNGHISVKDSTTGRSWYVDGFLKTPEILKEYTEYLKAYTVADYSHYKYVKEVWDKACKHDLVPIPTAGGVTHVTISAIGMDRVSYMIRKYPKLVKNLIDTWCKLTIEEHKCFFETGIDMMFICDDYAQKGRLMINPKVFIEFIEPAYKKIADNAHKYGAKFIVHSDGDLTDSFPSMVRAGVDATEPLEYEAGMRLKGLKEKWGNKITLIGNIPASDALCVGTVEDTIRFTKQAILDAGEGGGLILGQGANLLATSKIANVQAMIATIKKYGVYPIDKNKILNSM